MWPFRKVLRGAAVAPSSPQPRYKWPDCAPVDKSDPLWTVNNTCNINGVYFLKKEVEPGRWQWVKDDEANRRQFEREARKRELFHALWARPLTDKEEAEAMGYGESLNIEPLVPYQAEDKRRELHDAWFQQRRLKLLARTETAQQPELSDTTK